MKLPAPYVCDECGRQKTESNHWFVAIIYGPVRERETLQLHAWPTIGEQESGMHLCSESCVSKTVSKWLGGSLPSANAEKSQPTNEPTEEERQYTGIITCTECLINGMPKPFENYAEKHSNPDCQFNIFRDQRLSA